MVIFIPPLVTDADRVAAAIASAAATRQREAVIAAIFMRSAAAPAALAAVPCYAFPEPAAIALARRRARRVETEALRNRAGAMNVRSEEATLIVERRASDEVVAG